METGPADILALLASLAYIQQGDIVVQSFGAHQGCAAAGDRVSGMMKNCGAVGFVTDGHHARSCGPTRGEPAQLVHGADTCIAL